MTTATALATAIITPVSLPSPLTIAETSVLLHRGLGRLNDLNGDSAREENGIGFSGSHTRIGRILATAPLASWTPWQLRKAFEIAQRYKNTQLTHLPWARLAVPPVVVRTPVITDRVTGQVRAFVDHSTAPRTIVLGADDAGAPAFVLTWGFARPLHAAVKASGARWSKARTTGWGEQVWTLPTGVLHVEAILDLAATHEFELAPDAEAIVDTLIGAVATTLESSRALTGRETASEFVVPGLTGTLRPFQVAGVEYLTERRTALLADDMGTGKTIQALSALARLTDYPALVICPAVVKLNWAKEALTWFPGKTVSILYGKPGTPCTASPRVRIAGETVAIVPNVLDADIVILNYDLAASWSVRLPDVAWKAIIADEAHYLKTGTTKRAKAIRQLATGYDADAKRRTGDGIATRYLLTGTPILNRPVELVSLLGILGRLGEFGGFRGFTGRYCDPKVTRFGTDLTGSDNLDELNTRLRLSCMIRRLKADVLTELPAKTRVVLDVELDNVPEYRRAESDVASWIGAQASQNTEFLATLDATLDARFGTTKETRGSDWAAERREQIGAQHDTAEARAARAEHLVRFSALKQLAAKGKIAAIIAWVTDFLEGDASRKIVLFAHHKEVVHALGAAFGCAEITGETSDQRRQDAVEAFQTNPAIRVIAGNIRAGGVGITLTAASDVLFAEQDWNPGVHDQAEDRINRIGQVNACTAWYFLGQDTIDQDIHELIEAKRGIVNAGTDGDVQTGTGIVHSLVAGLRRRAKATAPKATRAARKATPVA